MHAGHEIIYPSAHRRRAGQELKRFGDGDIGEPFRASMITDHGPMSTQPQPRINDHGSIKKGKYAKAFESGI